MDASHYGRREVVVDDLWYKREGPERNRKWLFIFLISSPRLR